MAVVNGTVSVKISIEGTGGGAAHAEKAKKAVEGLKKSVGEAGPATAKLAGEMQGLGTKAGGTVKSLDGFRAGFENLRSNFLGMPMAIAGVVTGLVTLIAKFAEGASAGGRLKAMTADYAKAVDGLRKDLEKLNEANGKAPAPDPDSPFGQAAGERYSMAIDKLSTLKDRLRELEGVDALRKEFESAGMLVPLLGEADDNYLAITKTQHEILELERDITRARDEGGASILRQVTAMRKLTAAALAGFGTPRKVIDLDRFGGETVVDPDNDNTPRGPRARPPVDPFDAIVRELSGSADRREEARRRADEAEAERERRDRMADYEAQGAPQGKAGKGRLIAGNDNAMGASIRDFSLALSEAIPGMGEFNGALSQIAETWSQWGAGSKSTRDAVVGSLGAIAKAGAAQIKDERARAGVLSIIELGLGFAAIASQNYPAAAAHFTASAILGSTAIFGGASGGSKGGGRGGGNQQQRPAQIGGETLGSGGVRVVIQGNYYGGRSEQEAGSDFARLTRRPQGTGFERGRDAA
jgi:hypothetical protein